jgi:hypothetical protein
MKIEMQMKVNIPREISHVSDLQMDAIQIMIEHLSDMVCYHHCSNILTEIENGVVVVVEKQTRQELRSNPRKTIQRDFWEGVIYVAKHLEDKYGDKVVGPWTEYELGRITGILDGLRMFVGGEQIKLNS